MSRHGSFSREDETEFERHQQVAHNRLATIVAKEPELSQYCVTTHPGPDLSAEDIRVLAVTVEMEDDPDPILGRQIRGVSRTAIRMVCGYDRNQQVKYRHDKLAKNGLIEMHKADNLPTSPSGSSKMSPGYAVATPTGERTVVEDLELLPILRRDRNTEAALADINSLLQDVHSELMLTTGRVMELAHILSQQTDLDIDFSDETKLRGYASKTLTDWDDDPDIFEPETLFERILAEEDQHTQKILIDMWMNKDNKDEKHDD